ncbi:protein FAM43A [Parasteatoda tepidariorum]|uniref:protein FAM43A n=1 Tax=Parasteatoda tepidariorum TaxID=114398 RepID=UPI00077FA94B|nr:protein FAM43A [Parasteatoda tepidariorum]
MLTMPMTIPLPSKAFLKFWKKRSVSITEYDPTFKVLYLGNILTSYAKGEGCTDKPLSTLWKAYTSNPAKVQTPMELTICSSGIKAVTKNFGVTEYWAYRISHCEAPAEYPGLFCWIYRHERPKMKQELRCHAALCLKVENAKELTEQLKERLALALQEFRREKLNRQKARLSLANAVYDCPSMPRRKLLLYRGSINFRPPIEMSKIAPKLGVIDEDDLEDDLDVGTPSSYDDLYMYSSSEASSLSSSPEDEELFSRFRMLSTSLNSNGEETASSYSDEDLFFDDARSNESDDIPLIT